MKLHRIKIIFIFIPILIISLFLIWFILNPTPYKTIEKLLDDPYKEIRAFKAKFFYEKELQNLKEKLKLQPPEWFLSQIKEDFSHISQLPITENSFIVTENFILENNIERECFRIKVIDNQIYVKNFQNTRSNSKIIIYFLKSLDLISKVKRLPDVDFMLFAGDIMLEELPDNSAPVFLFSLNTETIKNKILAPDPLTLNAWPVLYYWILNLNSEIEWKHKIDKAFWRGSNTGLLYNLNNGIKPLIHEFSFGNFAQYPRVRLVELSTQYPELLDAKFVNFTQVSPEVANFLERKYPITKQSSKKQHLLYKIQINMDGNSATYPGYLWRLLSNSITLKEESNYIQWFYRIMKPWQHYIPIKSDMSDIKEKIEWVRSNDKEACQISERASKLVRENLKPTDIYWYIYVLLQEYSKLQDFKPEYDPTFIEIKEFDK